MTSSSAATRGAMFLPCEVAGATKASWWPISVHDQRRDVFGQRVGIGGVVGQVHLADAGDLRGGIGNAAQPEPATSRWTSPSCEQR
jgi:hypothetical protein